MEFKLLLQMLRKRLWLIVLVVVLCSAGTGAYSVYVMKPVYEASSTMIVNKSNMDSEGKPTLDINEINSNIMLINSYKVIITSASVMDKVVRQYPSLNVTTQDLRDRVSVETAQNSQIIELKVRDASYEQAMNIVNAVSRVFKDEIPLIMKVDNISILDNAAPKSSPKPVVPNVKLYTAAAFVISLMAAVCLVLFLEYLDDTIKSEEDVERYLELTTLGSVRKMKKRDLRSRSADRSKKQAGEKYASVSQ
ncbi:YveK family protein [Paenibacillus sp. S28]|uniref:YveK family protein n=1 Tax=Paenibacillus sp. S28 TaxID=2767463 RepID=UPI00190B49E1|nr:Wzz/FepE/Etk N-terminal domain-containing protein [Paenibacillus sp. S28]MBJ9991082.1 lipopolysaccharide biosynthesis protein [Paenibacillus sp. S28]